MSSDNYASRLSEYRNKGICGLPEILDTERNFVVKMKRLMSMVQNANHIVVLTGAGVSTASGIPDFRGPNGIWTKEEQRKNCGKKRKRNDKDDNRTDTDTDIPMSFETAKPTLTHRAITRLSQNDMDIIKYVITQNVDGLHMRSGMQRSKHCFLHGCIFTEKCEDCAKEYFRDFDIGGVSFEVTGRKCDCGGKLRDTVLDWEDALPEEDWQMAQDQCERSDLVLVLGSSLRIEPVGSLPTLAKQFVIVNKQVTPYDDRAALIIRANVDKVFETLMENLNISIP
jgi:mono-ADP-ribosyltransferase sirtuin 6